jgi:hypothetical protein
MIMQNGCGFWLQVYITFTFDQAAVIFRGQPSTTAMAPAWTVSLWVAGPGENGSVVTTLDTAWQISPMGGFEMI